MAEQRRPDGSIVDLGGGKFRVVVSARPDPISGARRRLTRTVFGGLRAAQSARSQLLAEAGKLPTATLTLREFVEGMWLSSMEPPRVRRRTRDEYKAKMDLYVLPTLGTVKLGDLEPYVLDRWLAKLATTKSRAHHDEHEPARNLSPRTRLHAYRALHAALHAAVLWRLVDSNALDAVKPPAVPRRKPDVLTSDEANAYIDAFAGNALEPVVLLAIGAGLRRSELAALSWKDVDVRSGTVSVSKGRHQRKNEVWIEPPKSQASRRIVALPPWCIEGLAPYRGIGPIAVDCGVWLTPETISARYRKVVLDAKLRYVPMKNLRHTSATLAIEAGASLYAVSKRLGHSSPSVTDAFYLSPDRSLDEDAARRLGGLRGRVPDCAEGAL